MMHRFEEPNPMSRWDSPLFTFLKDDPDNYEAIWNALIIKKPMKTNKANIIKPLNDMNYLSSIDSQVSKLIEYILKCINNNEQVKIDDMTVI